jgi:hypothetical protein
VGGSANGYDYVNQDPVNFSDPTGNESKNWLFTGVTGAVAFVVGALIAPARGALVGVLVGAIAGAALTGLSHAIEYAVTGQTEFSITRLGISILAGAVGGGIGGRVKWARAKNTTRTDDPLESLFDDASSTSSEKMEWLYGSKVQGAPSQSAASGLVRKQAVSASFIDEAVGMAQPSNVRLISQSDVAGIRLLIARTSKSVGDESGVLARAASVRSRSSGYSLAPYLRVSEDLERMSIGSNMSF